ncbi:MAG TPA: FtsQ-type POTRA domain-containing protein [Planktothrix sp.]
MSTAYVDKRKDWIRSRRKRRKHARQARLNRQVFRYILLLAVMWGGYRVMTYLPWAVTDPKTEISVRGNTVATTSQIETAMGSLTDKKIFQIDPHQLEKKVETLKVVKYAFVRRYTLPKPCVIVQVLEEVPWATFTTNPDGPPEAVISQSGKLISIKDFPSITQPPLTIYGSNDLKMTSKTVAQWASYVEFIKAQTGEPVAVLDLRHPYDIRVVDGDLYLKLGTADATLTRRLGRLTSILASVQPLKSRLEYIDLALDNNIPLKLAKKPIEGKNIYANDRTAQLPGRANL